MALLFKNTVEKYTTEPLHTIVKDPEEDDCYYKRISEHETLLVRKLASNDPQVCRIFRSEESLPAILTKNLPVTKYYQAYLSGGEKQAFLDEVYASNLKPRSKM